MSPGTIASIPITTRQKTIADLLHELGDVPAHRVLLAPAPGAATEQDLLALLEHAPVVPNLAVEVIGESNTRPEIERKLQEYFSSGVQLVWIFDPRTRAVAIHLSAGPPSKMLTEADTLDGGAVLPGFELNLAQLFAELERPDAPPSDGHRA